MRGQFGAPYLLNLDVKSERSAGGARCYLPRPAHIRRLPTQDGIICHTKQQEPAWPPNKHRHIQEVAICADPEIALDDHVPLALTIGRPACAVRSDVVDAKIGRAHV